MGNLDHLIVGVDGSTGAANALDWAVAQAPRHLTAVHAFSPGLELLAASVQINLDPVRAEHQRLLDTAWTAAARDGAALVETVLIDDNAANALSHVAASRHGDAIVIGHQGHRRWHPHHIGETAGRLLHHCDTPLILTSDTTEPEAVAGTMIVGLSRPADPDNSELRWALDAAEQRDAPLHLVCLVEPTAYVDAQYSFDMTTVQAELREQMTALATTLQPLHSSFVISTEVRLGSPALELAAVARETEASLVVVGSHHPGLVRGFVGGSVARLLPPLVDCPTAVIPHG